MVIHGLWRQIHLAAGLAAGLATALAVPSCVTPQPCRLTLTAPFDGQMIGPKDDVSNAIPGIQVNVTVAVTKLEGGSVVRLSANGGPASSATVAGGQVVFSAFTLAPDDNFRVALVASADKCLSEAVSVSIPPPDLLLEFVDPRDHFAFGQKDNQNPDLKDLTFMRDVKVVTNAEAGSIVALTVNGLAQPPVEVQGGRATFPGVVLPPSAEMPESEDLSLVATVADSRGNPTVKRVNGRVNTTPPPCGVTGFFPGFVIVKGIAVPVLNASVDEDPKVPGEQTEVRAATLGSNKVTLLVDGIERASRAADQLGLASFDHTTIAEGSHLVQVRCADATNSVLSTKQAVFVDSQAPVCKLTGPTDDAVFGPAVDVNLQKPGVQITAALTSSSPDAEGQVVSFGVNGVDQGAPQVAITGGAAAHEVTLTAPGKATNTVTATVSDAAANVCLATVEVGLDIQGCALIFLRPKPLPPPKHAEILADDDTSPPIDDGLQYDLAFAVDQKCIGKKVHLTVDGKAVLPDRLVVADAGQKLGARADFPSATVCPPGPNGPTCHGVYNFFATVTDNAGEPSGATLDVFISAVPPKVFLAPAAPKPGLAPLACGGSVTTDYDIDPLAPGVQIIVSATTTARLAEVRVGGSTADALFPPQALGSRLSTITLPEGYNTVVARAVDSDGNSGYSNPCVLVLQGLALTIASPLPGGLVRASSATVSGTVSIANATITLYVDGAPVATGTAQGNQWSLTKVSVPSGQGRLLRADAIGSGHAGSVSVIVTSDGQSPTLVADLLVSSFTRSTINLIFSAPSDDYLPLGSYLLRWATSPITAQTFALANPAMAPAPAIAGTKQTATVTGVYTGVTTFLALQTLDRAGNPSALSNPASTTPTFVRGLFAPPADPGEQSGKRGFGQAAASGDWNGDGIADLAVGAPLASYSGADSAEGAVYVWFGGNNGPAPSPDLILRGAQPGAHTGAALAAGDLDGDGKADLVVAAPDLKVADQNAALVAVGGVYLLQGGATFVKAMAPRPIAQAAASLLVGDPDDPQMAGARVGAALAITRFDGDALADLVIGTPGAENGAGGASVIAGAAPLPKGALLPKDLQAKTVRGWRLGCSKFPGAKKFGEGVADAGLLQGPADKAREVAVASVAGERVAIFTLPNNAGVDLDGAVSALGLLHDTPGLGFGAAVAGAPDGDGNGYGELLLGEPLFGQGAGRLLRIDGSKLPGGGQAVDAAQVLNALFPGAMGEAMASSVAGADDLNGDGHPDVVYASGGKGGQLRVLYGPTPYSQGAPSGVFPAAAGAASARIAVLLGDLDHDGLPDLLLLDPTHGAGAGRIELYH